MWRTLITISCLSVAVLAQQELVVFNQVDIDTITHNVEPLPDRTDTQFMCPKGFEQIKENCYYVSKRRVNWDEADVRCKNKNSTLLEISDEDIERRLREYISDPSIEQVERWIGARYNPAESAWVWGRIGEKISYNGFRQRKFFRKNLNWYCAAMNPKRSYHWIPRLCHKRKHYICHTPAVTALEGEEEVSIVNQPKIAKIPRKNKTLSYRTDTQSTCPNGFEQIEKNCYYVSKHKVNWDEADVRCKIRNSALLELPDENSDKRLRAYISDPSFEQVDHWIGARYNPLVSAWIWGRTGEKISFNGFWRRKFFRKKLDWHCGITNHKRSHQWAPRLCHKLKHYICHTPASDIPSDGYTLQTTDSPSPIISEKSNEALEQNTDDRNEIPLRNRRRPESRYARKSHDPISGNELDIELEQFSNTRWAPGTKRSDRLRLMKSQDSNEPDQWVSIPRLTALNSKNEKIKPEENQEAPLTENYRTGARNLTGEPDNAVFELKRVLSSDFIKEEILLNP